MANEYTISNPQALETPHERDSKLIGELNRELLVSGETGALLSPIYEIAVRADPRLERVRLVKLDSQDDSRLGFAKHGFGREDRIHEVHFRIGHEGIEATQTMLKEQAPSIEVVAKKLGIRSESVTAELLAQFVFLHELGHAKDFIDHDDGPEAYIATTNADRMRLPIAGKTPKWLKSEEGRRFVEAHWDNIQTTLRVQTFDELLELQSEAYRKLPDEARADNFAGRLLRRQVAKRGIVASLMARVTRR